MSFKTWTEEHQGIWEFIKFNILSNVSTISRFVFTWIGTAIFINAMQMTQPFQFLIFNYTEPSSNGLGGFVTFLIAEVVAQVVNFFVQMKWVFKSDASFKDAAWKYAILAVVIVVVNLILPGYVMSFCQTTFGWDAGLSGTVASVVNTLLAVIVSFPLLKFWIMPSKSPRNGRAPHPGAPTTPRSGRSSVAGRHGRAPSGGRERPFFSPSPRQRTEKGPPPRHDGGAALAASRALCAADSSYPSAGLKTARLGRASHARRATVIQTRTLDGQTLRLVRFPGAWTGRRRVPCPLRTYVCFARCNLHLTFLSSIKFSYLVV